MAQGREVSRPAHHHYMLLAVITVMLLPCKLLVLGEVQLRGKLQTRHMDQAMDREERYQSLRSMTYARNKLLVHCFAACFR